MIIVGLDISLTSTGMVKIATDPSYNGAFTFGGFTSVKKIASIYPDKISFYHKDQFRNYFDRTNWMLEKIKMFCLNADYVAIEDYAFDGIGMSFHIGEFTGQIKQWLYNSGKHIRFYDITSVKKFATGSGNAKKPDIAKAFVEKYLNTPGGDKFSLLPDGRSPKEDITDAFFICKLLERELQIRSGDKNLSEIDKWIFARQKKKKRGVAKPSLIEIPFTHND